jgi:hypothetical protein
MAGNRHRLKIKVPFFGEGEAEGVYGIAALVIIVGAIVVVVTYLPR